MIARSCIERKKRGTRRKEEALYLELKRQKKEDERKSRRKVVEQKYVYMRMKELERDGSFIYRITITWLDKMPGDTQIARVPHNIMTWWLFTLCKTIVQLQLIFQNLKFFVLNRYKINLNTDFLQILFWRIKFEELTKIFTHVSD